MLQTLANLFNPAAYFNPWSLLAGLLLIAAPIIIHLIHRMRFKRVKWAAMEFLLKAQRRMKRKMIIEQLLLLILRCLLMLLVGLLVARYFGFNATGKEATTTQHYVILDDSPSMADLITEDGQETTTTFEVAKRALADKIAPALADATTPQLMAVARASEPDLPINVERLNAASVKELKDNLVQYQPSTVRANLSALVRKAGEALSARGAEVGKVLHVVSDFRGTDWNEAGDALKDEVKKLTDAGVKVHLVDVAHPYRKVDKKLPAHHDNIGIVELKPMKAVVAKFEEVEFTLKVRNYGTAEVKDQLVSIRVNGDEGKGGRSVNFASIPPGQEATERFALNFERSGNADNPFTGKLAQTPLAEGEKLELKRAFERFNIVSAVIMTKESTGLEADNVRHTAVEVRETLPILVVDANDPEKRDAKEGESLYLKKFIASSGTAFQWNYAAPADVANTDLSKFSFVLVLNVPGLSEAAVKNLEGFVQNGGGCGFWLGERVKPADYNKGLYRDGEGLFPVPLPPEPFPAKSREQMSEDEREADEMRVNKLKFNIFQKKLLVRDPALRAHPALAAIYSDGKGAIRDPDELEKFYRFVTVQRYWPIERLGRWTDDQSVTELMCLANEKKFKDYEQEANALVQALPVADPDFTAFKEPLTKIRGDMTRINTQADPSTSQVAELFDRLLSDQRNEGDKDEALLREFWQKPEMADLKGKVTRLRDRMKYGYPLYLTKNYGRGRVTVITTTAGEAWTDWPNAQPGNVSFIPVMKELVNYLAGGGVDDTRTCGRPIEFRLDPESYELKVLKGFVTHTTKPGERPAAGGGNDPAPVGVSDQFDPLTVETVKEKVNEVGADGKTIEKEVERRGLTVSEANTSRPGVYLFGLEQKRPKPGAPTESVTSAEYRFAPVNLDVPMEGDLRRANTDDVLATAPGAELHGPDETEWLTRLQNKKTDLSSMGWLFLFLLMVLVAEQALAVKLSYHSGQESVAEHAPSAAAALRRAEVQLAVAEQNNPT
ncbi:MAG: BatA domain-containing protein [Fimbriiglobus sp.]|nr:BatA domain-containing protein [Fimbriiglobus sp.]